METASDNFRWSVHPARERPLATVAAVMVILAFGVAVALFADSKLWGVLAAVVLCLALNRFFFRSDYEMNERGVHARHPLSSRQIDWSEISRIDTGTTAAWLSPYCRRHWREFRHGVHLLFGRHRAQVTERLARHAPQAPRRTTTD